MITRDGCAVDLYRRLPALGEPELIHGHLPPGASVLDLGCGVGRIANRLAALGHQVVVVDDSPEMLSHVRAARPVCSRIETLNLPERFGGVVMASHLANVPADDERHALYRAARRHLAPAGVAFVQWHPPEWFDRLTVGTLPASRLGDVTSALRVHAIEAGWIDATVTYELDDSTWSQRFRTRRISDAELLTDLDTCGLAFDTFLDESRTWFQVGAR